MSDWTPEQIESVIPDAIRDGDLKAVEGLLKMLAVRDPARAQVVMDTIGLGIELSMDT